MYSTNRRATVQSTSTKSTTFAGFRHRYSNINHETFAAPQISDSALPSLQVYIYKSTINFLIFTHKIFLQSLIAKIVKNKVCVQNFMIYSTQYRSVRGKVIHWARFDCRFSHFAFLKDVVSQNIFPTPDSELRFSHVTKQYSQKFSIMI